MPNDIAPGTYRTTTHTSDCYWTRLRGFDSGLDDLIAGNIGSGYQVVTIGPRDAGFDSVTCGNWTADLRQVTETPTQFGEGTYIVGTDIEPGFYSTLDAESCSWLRLSGFGFARRDIIARGFTNDSRTVTLEIAETDTGFSSSGCGTWAALLAPPN